MCANADIPADHTLQEFYMSKHKDEAKQAYEEGRERIKKLKQSTKKRKGGGRIRVTVEEKAVQLGKLCLLKGVEWGISHHHDNHSSNAVVLCTTDLENAMTITLFLHSTVQVYSTHPFPSFSHTHRRLKQPSPADACEEQVCSCLHQRWKGTPRCGRGVGGVREGVERGE